MFAIVWSIISPAGARYSMNSSRALSLFLILYSTVRSKWVHLILYSTVYSASGPKQVGLQFFAGQYSTVPVYKNKKTHRGIYQRTVGAVTILDSKGIS